MKKIIITLLLVLSMPITAFAEYDCPYGQVEEAYPGTCGLYTDQDSNAICDHSQVALENEVKEIPNTIQEEPTLKVEDTTVNILEVNAVAELSEEEVHDLIEGRDLKDKTVQEIADIYEISASKYAEELSKAYDSTIKSTDSFQLLHDNYAIEPSIAKDIAASIRLGEEVVIEIDIEERETVYHLVPITIFLTLLYILTRILLKTKKITRLTHMRFWNSILLLSFMISGILGILLVIKVNFGIVFALPFNILFWHAEVGISMVVICVFHIIERWYFFKNMLVRGR